MNNEIENNTSSKNKNRRDFLNILLKGGFLAWLISIVYPIYDYLEPPKAEEPVVEAPKEEPAKEPVAQVAPITKGSRKVR